ncbi:hypothetical protein B0H19DRAFT_1264690 [Mycena capillaripes]|nr:hypothetical protein B0H19DRAFT_1264690 [Mycena capillaripes]
MTVAAGFSLEMRPESSLSGNEDECSKGCCSSNLDAEQGAVPVSDGKDGGTCTKACCSPDVPVTTPDPELEISSNGEDAGKKGCCDVAATAPDSEICSDDEEACKKGCCSASIAATVPDSEICSDNEDACTNGCCSAAIAAAAPDSNICSDKEDACAKGCCSPSSDSSDNKDKEEAACQRGCCSSQMEVVTQSEDGCSCCGDDEDEDARATGARPASLEINEAINGVNCADIEDDDEDGELDDCCTLLSITVSLDSVCPCCIAILVQHPEAIGRTLVEAKSDRTLFPENSAHKFSATVRKCCRLFKSVCAQRPCCMPVPRLSKKPIIPVVASSCKQPEEHIPTQTAPDNLTRSSPSEPLKLEISGMDCADCCTKVTRALLRLPSVKPVHLDYLEAVASLLYDPEIITPEGIARYVARATSFGIKAIGKEDARPSTHLTLPITFSRAPPAHVLEKFSARHRNELNGFVEISFPIRGDGARQPRQVLMELAEYGPRLLPVDAIGRADDRVAQDLRRIALRTLLIIVLAIPVLVFAWAPLPERPLAYGIVSVVLTTLIQLAAFPILSSSVRSIIFLRTVDMSVLVSVSTLSAWIFSVVSFAFEVAGKPFAAPFFETAALLVALIYVGRLVQALTRRATTSAIRALQQLQPSNVILVEQIGRLTIEKELDAR